MRKLFLAVMSCLVLTVPATSSDLSELTKFVQSSISNVGNALADAKTDDQTYEQDWYFKVIMVRLQAKFGIGVDWIAGFTVIPEIEMIFVRQLPDGIKEY